MHPSVTAPLPVASQTPRRWRTLRFWFLGLLAAQYALFQVLTGVQYWDSPRNLHWGIVVQETPRFLLDTEDPYDRVNGFAPDPAGLAPAGLAHGRSAPLHPWWGPLYLLLFGTVWRLTGSYALLQLIVPLAAGTVVLLTYTFGVRHFGRDGGMLAAVLLALFPLFREHGPLSFVEPLSALILFAALNAFLERRAWLAALLGSLAMYGKIDLIFLYLGTGGVTWLLSLRSDRPLALRYALIGLAIPALCLLPWLVLVYGVVGRPMTVGGGARWEVFLALAPHMLEQLFMLPLALTTPAAALLLVPAGLALWHRAAGAPTIMLGTWLALGVIVLLVYAAMPGASNNPRVFIPTLPALCLLAAAGFARSGRRLRTYALAALLSLFVVVNSAGIFYQILQARATGGAMPAWEALRNAPHGVVLTEWYWQAALYARQPVTWFEHDPAFQRNIMHSAPNFKRYLATTPIRYVVLPRDQDAGLRRLQSPEAKLYRALPVGRELDWSTEPVVSDEVRAFLNATFAQQVIGEYIIYTVRRP